MYPGYRMAVRNQNDVPSPGDSGSRLHVSVEPDQDSGLTPASMFCLLVVGLMIL